MTRSRDATDRAGVVPDGPCWPLTALTVAWPIVIFFGGLFLILATYNSKDTAAVVTIVACVGVLGGLAEAAARVCSIPRRKALWASLRRIRVWDFMP